MTIVSAFLVPASPLPYMQPDNPPWSSLAEGMRAAGAALEDSAPDTIVIYSTGWFAVLDQLWQMRPHLQGVHVDHNWHEYGELPFDIRIDTELTQAAIDDANAAGIKSKGVDYDQFPIDTGTIVAANFLNPDHQRPLLNTANNLYHDWDITERLGALVAAAAERMKRNIAVVAVGGLSGAFYRHSIDIAEDRIVNDEDDRWNRKILGMIEAGNMDAMLAECPNYVSEAKVDMGFKHMAFIKGALGGGLSAAKGGKVHAYGPVYGAGAAVIEFSV